MNQNNLPDEFGSPSVFYSKFYKSVIFGKGLGPWSIRKTHQSMEKAYSGSFFAKVLEIGGGVGEHLNFVLHDYEKYFLTDISLPVLEDGWKDDPRVVCEVQNAEDLTYKDDSFDRIIVTCLLHHVDKPEIVMKEIQRVLKPGGIATVFLPCDPGLLVRFLRASTTARGAKRSGFQGYGLMISREHRNHFSSLVQMAKYNFKDGNLRITYHPFRFPSWNANGYAILQFSKQINYKSSAIDTLTE